MAPIRQGYDLDAGDAHGGAFRITSPPWATVSFDGGAIVDDNTDPSNMTLTPEGTAIGLTLQDDDSLVYSNLSRYAWIGVLVKIEGITNTSLLHYYYDFFANDFVMGAGIGLSDLVHITAHSNVLVFRKDPLAEQTFLQCRLTISGIGIHTTPS